MAALPEQRGVKEAYALAYAAFRLAASLDNPAFRQSFEDRGLKLLLAALDKDKTRQIDMVRDLEYLVGFGRDVGSIHPQTAEIMLAEIGKFNPAIYDPAGQAPFTEHDPKKHAAPMTSADLFPKKNFQPPAAMPEISSEGFSFRKDRILDRIRQSSESGNPAIGCRLRDIQEVMAGLSERTLRYDLQRLVGEGLIDRVGNGGPATFYRIRQSATANFT